MKRMHSTIEIETPPDRVWATMRDVERWSEWTPTIISIQPLDPGPLAVGTRVIIRQPKLLPARWRVTELQEGRSFTWITRGPGILVTARHSIEHAAIGSRVTLSVDFSGPLGPLCALLTGGLTARYLSLEAQGFKKCVEAQAPSQASKLAGAGASR